MPFTNAFSGNLVYYSFINLTYIIMYNIPKYKIYFYWHPVHFMYFVTFIYWVCFFKSNCILNVLIPNNHRHCQTSILLNDERVK